VSRAHGRRGKHARLYTRAVNLLYVAGFPQKTFLIATVYPEVYPSDMPPT
jgi:hypothetical protein